MLFCIELGSYRVECSALHRASGAGAYEANTSDGCCSLNPSQVQGYMLRILSSLAEPVLLRVARPTCSTSLTRPAAHMCAGRAIATRHQTPRSVATACTPAMRLRARLAGPKQQRCWPGLHRWPVLGAGRHQDPSLTTGVCAAAALCSNGATAKLPKV